MKSVIELQPPLENLAFSQPQLKGLQILNTSCQGDPRGLLIPATVSLSSSPASSQRNRRRLAESGPRSCRPCHASSPDGAACGYHRLQPVPVTAHHWPTLPDLAHAVADHGKQAVRPQARNISVIPTWIASGAG